MEVVFQLLVGLIIAALGGNLFTKAPEDAAAERTAFTRWLWGSPDWAEGWRLWTNRILGGLLVVFGVGISVGAFV